MTQTGFDLLLARVRAAKERIAETTVAPQISTTEWAATMDTVAAEAERQEMQEGTVGSTS